VLFLGQFNDLINMFILLGKPPSQRYIFLGDFVDRGGMSLECIMLLLSYKVSFILILIKSLIRFSILITFICFAEIMNVLASTESKNLSLLIHLFYRYGFFEEIDTIFPPYISNRIWALFQRVFNVLPVGGIIEKKILCMHGGG
jgi:hypothetical protein